MEFRVSVIIPAFNSERFIRKAVNSALQQQEVREVVIVDDGSTDSTLEIINAMAAAEEKVKVFFHENNINRGRSASRNLGIKKAVCAYIAFLDSDDYYLDQRFREDAILFSQDPAIDGVYNTIGVEFYREYSKDEKKRYQFTGIRKKIPPEDLFHSMWPKGSWGYFHCNGITIKKKVFHEVSFFNEDLEVAEDTELWIKLALKRKLVGGKLSDPVALRGIHEGNLEKAINNPLYMRNYARMYNDLLRWGSKENLNLDILEFFWRKSLIFFKSTKGTNEKKAELQEQLWFWLKTLVICPKLIMLRRFVGDFPVYKKIKRLT